MATIDVVYADSFEHGSDIYGANDDYSSIFLGLDVAVGAPDVGAAFAKNGGYGVRVGRAGANDDYYNIPAATFYGGPHQTVEYWWQPKNLGTDGATPIICNFVDPSNKGASLFFCRSAGPVYFLAHAGTANNILTLTLGNWYRIRWHIYMSGSAMLSWLWVWAADGTLLVDGDYRSVATTETTARLRYLGTYGASLGKWNVDCYMDDIVYAEGDAAYWTTTPTITKLTPDADDATEDAWTDAAGNPTTWSSIEETPPVTTDYAKTTTDGALQLWGTDAALAGSPDYIAVGIGQYLREFSASGINQYWMRIKDGADVGEEDLGEPDGGAYLAYVRWWQAAPGGGAWTPAKVNGLLVGGRWATDVGQQLRVAHCMGYAVQITTATVPTPPAVTTKGYPWVF